MKRLISLLLVCALLLPLCLNRAARAAGLTVSVDGAAVSYAAADGQPYLTAEGVPMIPVACTMACYGISPIRDEATGETLLQMGTKEVRLAPGSDTLIVNGGVMDLPAPVVLTGGVLYAPGKELTLALGGWYQFAGNRLDLYSQFADGEMIQLVNSSFSGNLWAIWNQANSLYDAGNYAQAIPLYRQVVPGFADNNTNLAIAFGKLGVCYARTGDYDRSAAAYSRSSYYWGQAGDSQTQILRYECAKSIRTELSLYLHTNDLTYSQEKDHGANYEPKRGTVIGYTTLFFNSPDNHFPQQAAKDAGMWLIYFTLNQDTVASKFQYTQIPENVVVELAVQPNGGASNVGFSQVTDQVITQLANDLHQLFLDQGVRVMVRYANEMNEPTSTWYVDPAVYKQEYIRFANILRQYAPEIPLIWAPNFWPMDNVDDYYPGDEYVDYVGVSSYISSYTYSAAQISAGYDVLGNGIKTSHWSQQIDFLYNHYGYKKPMMIAEGAASNRDKNTQQTVPDTAAAEILDYYTYLPMRYPNLKYAVYFNIDNPDKGTYYDLTSYPQTIGAYNQAISDDQFLSSCQQSSDSCYVPFETLTEQTPLRCANQQLCAYVKYGDNTQVKALRYEINGAAVGTATQAPYAVNVNFDDYRGQDLKIRVVALDGSGKELTSKLSLAKVMDGAPTSGQWGENLSWSFNPDTGLLTFTGSGEMAEAPSASLPWLEFLDAITAVSLPEGLTSICTSAFHGCANLTEVVIPDTVTAIGDNAFAGCDGLTDVYYAGTQADWEAITFGTQSLDPLPEGLRLHPETADPQGHWTLQEPTWPNCTDPGTQQMTCPCGYSQDLEVPAQGHDWDKGVCQRCQYEAQKASEIFRDVKNKDYFAAAVLWAVRNGITAGVDETHFGPKQDCTRAQIVTFLWAAMDRPEPSATENPFTDVKKKHYFYSAVLWALENGITKGVDETHFGPNQACTRAQAVTFLWTASGQPEPTITENPFTDVKKKQYYYKAVLWALENGITAGVDETHFGPNQTCTRGQIVTFLYNTFAETP